MCGVFGFASNGEKANVETLKRLARVTMTRGPHAWGMAWLDGKGRLKMFKQSGRIVDHLGILSMARDARFLIGHCRFATHGDPSYNINNHPHPADGGWVVHNGVVSDHLEVKARLGLTAVSQCDSEVLCRLIEWTDGDLAERCVEAVLSVKKAPLVMLGLWKPGRLVAVRQGNPLHLGDTGGAFYLASLAEGVPGKVREVKDETVTEFTEKGATYAAF
jgi:glucosamine--fructose-6-phosphate aminotransferase (isomerizing)